MAFIEAFYRRSPMMPEPDGRNQGGMQQKAIEKGLRIELMEELHMVGIAVEPFEQFTLEQLEQLVDRIRVLNSHKLTASRNSSGAIKGKENIVLTEVDKKMLQTLLASSGRVSSLALSRKLEIPLTTIQRRRKRLESEFLEVDYSLRLDKLGWRNADLLISTSRGAAASIGKELLSHNAITRVCRSIGEHTIDLHAQMVFKNNTELLNVIEWIKGLDGVRDVIWTEPVELVGKNIAGPLKIIDLLRM
jgi:DNA-binding Lrp family transcriptional regulator